MKFGASCGRPDYLRENSGQGSAAIAAGQHRRFHTQFTSKLSPQTKHTGSDLTFHYIYSNCYLNLIWQRGSTGQATAQGRIHGRPKVPQVSLHQIYVAAQLSSQIAFSNSSVLASVVLNNIFLKKKFFIFFIKKLIKVYKYIKKCSVKR